jgi:hypothetical protein
MKKGRIYLLSILIAVILIILPHINAIEQGIKQSEIEQNHIFSTLQSVVKNSLFSDELNIWEIMKFIISIIIGGYIGYTLSDIYLSRTVYVDDDAPDSWYDYFHVSTIHEAIDHANKGYANKIRVYDGTYDGDIMMSSGYLNPGNMGHWLIGNGSGSTIIDAEGCSYGVNFSRIDGWCRVIGFTIKNASGCGIDLGKSQWNFITENTLINNGVGISKGSKYCPIWKNNFISNGINAYDPGENEWSFDWYGDIPIAGNYWDDYQGIDSNGDGFGDTAYEIEGGSSVDSYPLIQPWEG